MRSLYWCNFIFIFLLLVFLKGQLKRAPETKDDGAGLFNSPFYFSDLAMIMSLHDLAATSLLYLL